MSEEQRNEGLPEEEFSALLQSIGKAAPLLGGLLGGGGHTQEHTPHTDACARREALLCALKPYLSKQRCDAVDYLLRLWRVGDAIKGLK